MTEKAPTIFRETITPDELKISPAASKEFARVCLESGEGKGIRIFVTGGSCAGMSCAMGFSERNEPYDRELVGEGFKIYVDAVAMNFLTGTEIDFVSDDSGSGFSFQNAFAVIDGGNACSSCSASGGGCA